MTRLGQSSPAAKSALLFYLRALSYLCNTGHLDPINVSDCFDAAKRKNSQLNQCGEFKTWHFTSVLTPTHEIHADINWLATDKIIVADTQILRLKPVLKQRL